MMKNPLLGFFLLAVLVLLAGCATEPSYQAPEQESEFGYPYVPPSYYNYNPQLEYWYTPPYWMPEIGLLPENWSTC